jgi:hypothetical protein
MKTLKHITTKAKNLIISILTYLFLVIDRLILTPFPFMESKSIEQYGKEEDSTLVFSLMRVTLAISIVIMITLINWIF